MYYLKRFLAFIIDWNITLLSTMLLFSLGPDFDFINPSIKMFLNYTVILGVMILIVFPLLKDLLFKNASLGKKVLGLRIIDAKTGNKPRASQVVIRNLVFYLVFLNAIVLLITKRSLGDMISGTQVVSKNS